MHDSTAPTAPPALPRRRFLIIRNRHAGLLSARHVGRVAAALEARGGIARIVETSSADEAQQVIASHGDIDAIVAAGGDGTIRALALAMTDLGLRHPLGLIPAGTGNVLANELALPRSADALAGVLRDAPAREIRIMQANGTPFILMASAGFDAQVLLGLSHALKQRVGRAAYAPPTLATLAQQPPRPFDVVVDGVPHRATWAIVSNVRCYGSGFTLVPEASIFDADLHAVLSSARTRTGRLRELLHLAAGRISRCPGIRIVRCRVARLEAPADMPTQADGDCLGHGPLEVGASGRTIPLIAPASAR